MSIYIIPEFTAQSVHGAVVLPALHMGDSSTGVSEVRRLRDALMRYYASNYAPHDRVRGFICNHISFDAPGTRSIFEGAFESAMADWSWPNVDSLITEQQHGRGRRKSRDAWEVSKLERMDYDQLEPNGTHTRLHIREQWCRHIAKHIREQLS